MDFVLQIFYDMISLIRGERSAIGLGFLRCRTKEEAFWRGENRDILLGGKRKQRGLMRVWVYWLKTILRVSRRHDCLVLFDMLCCGLLN